jgi:hypothetical protein
VSDLTADKGVASCIKNMDMGKSLPSRHARIWICGVGVNDFLKEEGWDNATYLISAAGWLLGSEVWSHMVIMVLVNNTILLGSSKTV